MRTADICPTCSTYSNALCTLYNGATLPTLGILQLDSLEIALIKIEAFADTGVPGTSIVTQDEGVLVLAAASTMNFVGGGVTATDGGANVTTVTIAESLRIDQTTPQTVSNGTPIFSAGINTSTIQFDVAAPAITSTPGQLHWNVTDDTLDLHANGVTYQIGQEISPLVRNTTGVTISNGTPVMFAGTIGGSGRVLITPAIADGSIISSYILGVATEDILNNADGHVTWFGKVRGLNTTGSLYGETWNDSDSIYVSPTTAGFLTNVPPQAPNDQIFIGFIINAHATVGSLSVGPSWRGKLTDLSDVNGTPLTTSGQILVWNQANSYFDPTGNINDYQLKHTGYTVAGLAGLSPVAGDREFVTDATAPTYNGVLTGGGAITIPVFYNGAAWVSA